MEEIQSNRPSKNGSVVQRTNITSHLSIALLSLSLSLSLTIILIGMKSTLSRSNRSFNQDFSDRTDEKNRWNLKFDEKNKKRFPRNIYVTNKYNNSLIIKKERKKERKTWMTLKHRRTREVEKYFNGLFLALDVAMTEPFSPPHLRFSFSLFFFSKSIVKHDQPWPENNFHLFQSCSNYR